MKALALASLLILVHEHGEHADYFRSLTVPLTGGSCCHDRDCNFTDDWRITGDRYEVRHEGKWLPVPPDRVLSKPSPTGRAVACVLDGKVICFVEGTLT
jgi:hypothetical protein